jgi:hypothetical protein
MLLYMDQLENLIDKIFVQSLPQYHYGNKVYLQFISGNANKFMEIVSIDSELSKIWQYSTIYSDYTKQFYILIEFPFEYIQVIIDILSKYRTDNINKKINESNCCFTRF